MNDRELLELAAKAAGINLEWDGHPDEWQPMYYEGKTYHSFDPLTNDGVALRLAVALGLRIFPHASTSTGYTCSAVADGANMRLSDVIATGDTEADVRRAIVMAAAVIGQPT